MRAEIEISKEILYMTGRPGNWGPANEHLLWQQKTDTNRKDVYVSAPDLERVVNFIKK